MFKTRGIRPPGKLLPLRAPRPFHLLCLPYDVRYRVHGVCLLVMPCQVMSMVVVPCCEFHLQHSKSFGPHGRGYGPHLTLLSTGETSLNMIFCNPTTEVTRDPLVSYLGRVGSPINCTVQSWRLPHNICILQTCKTVNVEKTPILYGKKKYIFS